MLFARKYQHIARKLKKLRVNKKGKRLSFFILNNIRLPFFYQPVPFRLFAA